MPPSNPTPARQTRVLVIDDDQALRSTLAEVLRLLGHAVVEAEDGRQGLHEFHHAAFDLVVTDIVMPEVEGLAVLMDLRKARPPVKVIAMSGGGHQEANEYLHVAKLMGASKVLAKPFGLDLFSAAVKELLPEASR